MIGTSWERQGALDVVFHLHKTWRPVIHEHILKAERDHIAATVFVFWSQMFRPEVDGSISTSIIDTQPFWS